MNIQNQDLLKTWLSRQLKPICKANPEHVSKYVIALLKKEENDSEMQNNLISSLYIFLNSATEEFVNALLDTLKTGKYLKSDEEEEVNENSENDNEPEVKIDPSELEKEIDDILNDTGNNEKVESLTISISVPNNKGKSAKKESLSPPSSPRKKHIDGSRRLTKIRDDNKRRNSDRRTRRDSNHHSPSPVNDRKSTRKRSMSRSSDSSNGSPRRSWNTSRAIDSKKYRYRNSNRLSSPARSRSSSPRSHRYKRDFNDSNTNNTRKRPKFNSPTFEEEFHNNLRSSFQHRPYFKNSNNIIETIKKVDVELPDSGPSSQLPATMYESRPKSRRCIDFENKGYCTRGNMCPFDHGPAPIVLGSNSMLNGIVPLNRPPAHFPNPPNVFRPPPPPPPSMFAANNVDKFAQLKGGGPPHLANGVPQLPPPPPHFMPDNNNKKPEAEASTAPTTNRSLISVNRVPSSSNPTGGGGGGKYGGHRAPKHVFSHVLSSLGVSQTSIELTNVPADLNIVPLLYEKFCTFGNITLVQVKRNGDPNTALITYSNVSDAAQAFIKCAKAIPDVKAAWYADKCVLNPRPCKPILSSSAKSVFSVRKNGEPVAAPAANTNTVSTTKQLVNSNNAETTPPTAAAATETTAAATLSTQADVVEAARPPETAENTDSNVSPVAPVVAPAPPVTTSDSATHQRNNKMLINLIKKKKDLLDKQLKSRVQIVKKICTMDKDSEDAKTWQGVLEKLDNVIAENRSSLGESVKQRKEYLQQTNIAPMDSCVLNSMNKQIGAEIAAASLADKRSCTVAVDGGCETSTNNSCATADSSGISPSKGTVETKTTTTTTAAAFVRDAPPTVIASSATVAGPARVMVSGFENGDEGDLIDHFSQYGRILDQQIDNSIPSAELLFENRLCAEQAKKLGRTFQDRLLTVMVYGYNGTTLPKRRRTTSFHGAGAAGGAGAAANSMEYAAGGSVAGSSYTTSTFGNGRMSAASNNPYKYTKPAASSTSPAAAASSESTETGAAVRSIVNQPPRKSVYTFRAEQRAAAAAAAAANLNSGDESSDEDDVVIVDNDPNFANMTDDEELETFIRNRDTNEEMV